jgi:phosphopantothenoylcysteine decarboxylase/phosphopantothenate--cysteine ligase
MHFLITAGPTREPIDPVRYISNRSSGRMGYALAEAALTAGHRVTLISGPVQVAAPQGATVISIETAQQMYDAVQAQLGQAQVAIFCAAVADYRPVQAATQKIKKDAEELTLHLERTPDILGSVRSSFGYQGLLCGFAAETHDLHAYATGKLQRKGCDVIVGNDVSQPGLGFDSQDNEVTLFYRDGRVQPLPRASKLELARQIIQVMEELHS